MVADEIDLTINTPALAEICYVPIADITTHLNK